MRSGSSWAARCSAGLSRRSTAPVGADADAAPLHAEAEPDSGALTCEPLRAVAPLAGHHRLERFDSGVVVLDRWLREVGSDCCGGWDGRLLCAVPGRSGGRLLRACDEFDRACGCSVATAPRDARPGSGRAARAARAGPHQTSARRLAAIFLSMHCVAVCAEAASSEHERWSLTRSTIRHRAFYRHFDFHQLDDRRLWRRLADVARALGK